MGPVRQNPIQRTVRSAYMCVQFTVQLLHTVTQYCTEQTWECPSCPPVAAEARVNSKQC